MTPAETFRIQSDIRSSIEEVDALLRTGVVQTGWPDEMVWPVLTGLAVAIRDLVYKSEHFGGHAVDFVDDVIAADRVKDAASLVKYFRDALCHIDSDHHTLREGVVFSRQITRGGGPFGTYDIDGRTFTSEYPDDIAIFIGEQRIYFRRHLVRAFQEAKAHLQAFLATR